jgi:hypothetical protein
VLCSVDAAWFAATTEDLIVSLYTVTWVLQPLIRHTAQAHGSLHMKVITLHDTIAYMTVIRCVCLFKTPDGPVEPEEILIEMHERYLDRDGMKCVS